MEDDGIHESHPSKNPSRFRKSDEGLHDYNPGGDGDADDSDDDRMDDGVKRKLNMFTPMYASNRKDMKKSSKNKKTKSRGTGTIDNDSREQNRKDPLEPLLFGITTAAAAPSSSTTSIKNNPVKDTSALDVIYLDDEVSSDEGDDEELLHPPPPPPPPPPPSRIIQSKIHLP